MSNKQQKLKWPLHKIVEVEWADASAFSGWRDISVYVKHTAANCKSCGYLLQKTKTTITIALSQCDNDDLDQAICIPLAWIKKITVIRK